MAVVAVMAVVVVVAGVGWLVVVVGCGWLWLVVALVSACQGPCAEHENLIKENRRFAPRCAPQLEACKLQKDRYEEISRY